MRISTRMIPRSSLLTIFSPQEKRNKCASEFTEQVFSFDLVSHLIPSQQLAIGSLLNHRNACVEHVEQEVGRLFTVPFCLIFEQIVNLGTLFVHLEQTLGAAYARYLEIQEQQREVDHNTDTLERMKVAMKVTSETVVDLKITVSPFNSGVFSHRACIAS